MAKATKRKAREARVAPVELEILDPRHFPDREAISAFVKGKGRDALLYAIDEALRPDLTIEAAAPGLTRDARDAAALVLCDVSKLTNAVLAGGRVRALRSQFSDPEKDLRRARRDLLAFAGLDNRVIVVGHETQVELIRFLGDGPSWEESTDEEVAA